MRELLVSGPKTLRERIRDGEPIETIRLHVGSTRKQVQEAI